MTKGTNHARIAVSDCIAIGRHLEAIEAALIRVRATAVVPDAAAILLLHDARRHARAMDRNLSSLIDVIEDAQCS